MREGTTSRVMAADRPYDECYDFYSVSQEYFGYHVVYRQKQCNWVRSLPSARLQWVICYIKLVLAVTFTGTTCYAYVYTYFPGNLKYTSCRGQIIIQCLIEQTAQSIINNILSLTLLLRVSTCSWSSIWRSIQRHTVTANYVKGVFVRL
jgi:hypothetical protein